MDINQVEALIDAQMDGLEIYSLKTEDAIFLACQFFETSMQLLDSEFKKRNIHPSKHVGTRELIHDWYGALDVLLRFLATRCTGTTAPPEGLPLWDVAGKAFARAFAQSNAEDLFKPFRKGLFVHSIEQHEDGPAITFNYKNENVALYEHINERLLAEYNASIAKKIEIGYSLANHLHSRGTYEDTFTSKSIILTEAYFDLPDDYKVGPYTIDQLKEVWYKVLREAFYGSYYNRNTLLKQIDSDIELSTLRSLNWKQWNFSKVSKDITQSILNDLSFKVIPKKYNSLFGEPVIDSETLEDKFIVPSFVLKNQHGRNIISTLNRKYAGKYTLDTGEKERIFVEEINQIISNFDNLLLISSIDIGDTDIDCIIYDKSNKCLIALELKWFNEPATADEIVSKDLEISKGLNAQLPKYEAYLKEKAEDVLRKHTGEELEVRRQYYFVLTRVTIGSGLIERPKAYRVISIRMLKKALWDNRGNLMRAATRMFYGGYLPTPGKHFVGPVRATQQINGVLIHSEGATVRSNVNYLTPDDLVLFVKTLKIDRETVKLVKKAMSGSATIPVSDYRLFEYLSKRYS